MEQINTNSKYDHVSEMIRKLQETLSQTISTCQSTIKLTEKTCASAKETIQKVDNFKNSFSEVLQKLTQNISDSISGVQALNNIEQYGQANIQEIKQINKCIKGKKHFIFLTGAGISMASGIPTYRGKGSIQGYTAEDGTFYSNQDIATHQFMTSNPTIFWQRELRDYDVIRKAKPNISHEWISKVHMEMNKSNSKQQFTLVTQNIDNLHIDSYREQLKITCPQTKFDESKMNPCPEIFQVHGNIFWGRCTASCSQKMFPLSFEEVRTTKQPPLCPLCGAKSARANVLYFDEAYNEEFYSINSLKDRIQTNNSIEEQDQILVVIGTTLETTYARNLVNSFVKNSKTVIEINRDEQIIKAGKNTYFLKGTAEEIVPQLCKQIIQNLK